MSQTTNQKFRTRRACCTHIVPVYFKPHCNALQLSKNKILRPAMPCTVIQRTSWHNSSARTWQMPRCTNLFTSQHTPLLLPITKHHSTVAGHCPVVIQQSTIQPTHIIIKHSFCCNQYAYHYTPGDCRPRCRLQPVYHADTRFRREYCERWCPSVPPYVEMAVYKSRRCAAACKTGTS